MRLPPVLRSAASSADARARTALQSSRADSSRRSPSSSRPSTRAPGAGSSSTRCRTSARTTRARSASGAGGSRRASTRSSSQVRPASHAFCCFCAAVLTGAPHPCVRVRAFDSAQGGVPGRDGHRRRDGAGGDRGVPPQVDILLVRRERDYGLSCASANVSSISSCYCEIGFTTRRLGGERSSSASSVSLRALS